MDHRVALGEWDAVSRIGVSDLVLNGPCVVGAQTDKMVPSRGRGYASLRLADQVLLDVRTTGAQVASEVVTVGGTQFPLDADKTATGTGGSTT